VPDTEVPRLTDFLIRELAELYSQSEEPQACPVCQGIRTCLSRKGKPKDSGGAALPVFRCFDCRSAFRRTTATPFHSICRHDLIPDFFRLLSQQKSFRLASRELGVNWRLLARWTRRTREWLLQIDPAGYWESYVRLGVAPILRGYACPQCGSSTQMAHQAFSNRSDSCDRRQFRCKACGCFAILEAGSDRLISRRQRPKIIALVPEIIARNTAGEKIASIARSLGICHHTASKIIKQQHAIARGESLPAAGSPGRKATFFLPGDVIADVQRRRDGGERLHAIARSLNLPYHPLYRLMAREQAKNNSG
jgi:transposase-like protein